MKKKFNLIDLALASPALLTLGYAVALRLGELSVKAQQITFLFIR